MSNDDIHLSDAELLQLIDGEVSGRKASRMEAHQTACWTCRARRAELEHTISDWVQRQRIGTEKLPADRCVPRSPARGVGATGFDETGSSP